MTYKFLVITTVLSVFCPFVAIWLLDPGLGVLVWFVGLVVSLTNLIMVRDVILEQEDVKEIVIPMARAVRR